MSGKIAGAGDTGFSSLLNGERVAKNSVVFECLGTIDELNSFIGYADYTFNWTACSEQSQIPTIRAYLTILQKRLIDIGSTLAMPYDTSSPNQLKRVEFKKEYLQDLEDIIANLDAALPKLTVFILPQGSTAIFHVIRSVVRRAERQVADLFLLHVCDQLVLKYINRLSDFFFVLARYLSFDRDITYKASKEKN